MNKVLYFILITILYWPTLYGQKDKSSYSPEELTNMEYEAGRKTISEIIINNNLHQALNDYAYAGYFSGELWLLIKKGINSYECYLGKQNGKIEKYVTLDLSNKELNSLFEWTNYQNFVSYDNWNQNKHYHPFYYYFILFDKNHNKKLEFNSSTMSAYRNAQKSRRTRKTLPFTKEQQKLIWKLFDFF